MRKHLKTFLLLCYFFLLGSGSLYEANAQGTGGGCFGTEEDPDNPCPIDGGLAFLLAAGAAYGVKKYRAVDRKGDKLQN